MMEPLKTRLVLGLTQQQLADYLSVSITNLAMTETNRRKLPESATSKLGNIENYMKASLSRDVNINKQRQLLQTMRMMTASMKKYEKSMEAATLKAEKMQVKEQQCVTLLRVIAGLEKTLPDSETPEKDRIWLKRMKTKALQKWKTCGISEQALLRVRIEGLMSQAEQANAIIQSISIAVKNAIHEN